MRRLFLLSLLSLPLTAAITVVEAKSAANVTVPVTIAITLSAGDFLYLIAGFDSNGGSCGSTTISMSDDLSNTYAPISGYVSQAYQCSRDYYVASATGGSATITMDTSTQPGYKAFVVYRVTSSTALSLDTSSSNTTCSASPCAVPSFSTTGADSIVFISASSYYGGGWSAGTIGGGSGTIATNGSIAGGTALGNAAASYRIFTSIQSSITGDIAQSGTIYTNTHMAAFKAAAAGGTPKRIIIVR